MSLFSGNRDYLPDSRAYITSFIAFYGRRVGE